MAKFDIMSTIFTMLILWVGGFLVGSFLLPMLPSLEGWMAGVFTGIVQMALLGVLGMTSGKIHLTNILIGGIIIFVGAILGGFLVGYIGLAGLYSTVVILLVQTILLTLMGYIKGKGPHL